MKRLLALALFFALAGGTGYATPPPPQFTPVLPLVFDGTSFRVPATFKACATSWDPSPYTAPSSGMLKLRETAMLMPGCAPKTNGTPAKLYIVIAKLPENQGIAIAGPVNAGEDPWIFVPIANACNMEAGAKYTFFVGAVRRR